MFAEEDPIIHNTDYCQLFILFLSMPLKHLEKKTFNPFVSSTPKLGLAEWLKVILVFPTLGLVRVLLIVALVLICAIWCFLFTIGASRSGPLPSWRATPVMGMVMLCARLILFALGFYYIPIVGHKATSRVCPDTTRSPSRRRPLL